MASKSTPKPRITPESVGIEETNEEIELTPTATPAAPTEEVTLTPEAPKDEPAKAEAPKKSTGKVNKVPEETPEQAMARRLAELDAREADLVSRESKVVQGEATLEDRFAALETQVKNLAELGTRVGVVTTPGNNSAETTKLQQERLEATESVLEKQPKVMFIIPRSPGEDEDATHEVQINGWVKSYKKGILLNVPESVAKLLATYYQVSMDAGKDFLASRAKVDPETGVSISQALN